MPKFQGIPVRKGNRFGGIPVDEQMRPKDITDEKLMAKQSISTISPTRSDNESLLTRAISNIPSSGARYAQDLIAPIMHPIRTAKSLGELGQGIAQKFTPGEQEQEKYVDAVGEFLKDRYGSLEATKETFATDPVGFMADIATIGIPISKTMQVAGKVPRFSAAAKAGKLTEKASLAFEPGNILFKGLSEAVRPAIKKKVPSRLYQSAAKFSTRTDLTIPKRAKLSETALKNEIMPTIKGYDRLTNKINKLNQKIDRKITQTTLKNKRIPVEELLRDIKGIKQEALRVSGTPLDEMNAIDNVAEQIKQANELLGRKELTARELQELKKGIYRRTENFYDNLSITPASKKAQQAIARTAKETLEEIIPGIRKLNQKDSDLISLRDELTQSAKRITNRDIAGIGVPIKGTAGGVVGGKAGMLAGLTMGLIDTPSVKAKLAIVLDKLRRQGIKPNAKSTAVRLGLVQSGRQENKGD